MKTQTKFSKLNLKTMSNLNFLCVMKTYCKTLLLAILAIWIVACQKEEKEENKQEVSRYATGLVIDPRESVENSYGTHIFEGGEELPLYKRLDFPENLCDLPYSYDQGLSGSCAAMSSAMCVSFMTSYQKRGMSFSDKYFFLSPSYLYNQKKLSSDCLRAGATIEGILDLVVDKGVPPVEVFPYDANLSCSIYPNSQQDKIASLTKIKGYNPIKLDKYQFKAALNKGFPIIIGTKVNDRFQYLYGQGGDYIYNTSDYFSDDRYQKHAMLCIGYDERKGEEGYFLVANSWGRGGFNSTGYVKISEKLLGKMIIHAVIVDEVYDEYKPLINLEEKDGPTPNPIPKPVPEPRPEPRPEPTPVPNPNPQPTPVPKPEPRISINTNYLSFQTEVGDVSQKEIDISNTGEATANIRMYIEGDSAFQLGQSSELSLWAHSNQRIFVNYQPQEGGYHNATLVINFNNRTERELLMYYVRKDHTVISLVVTVVILM